MSIRKWERSEFGNVGGTSNKTGENPTSLQFQVFLI